MLEREIGELRRRLRKEKCAIQRLSGCYVDESGQIVTQFTQSLTFMEEEETEKLFATLRKTLSGSLGKNLTNLSFSTQDVVSGEKHKTLMALRESDVQPERVQAFYETVASHLHLPTAYLILLAQDAYDVPFRGKDRVQVDDGSSEVFRYVLCCICPVKTTKPALSYFVKENEFHNSAVNWLVGAPEVGFLFPAFDDRATNLYGALYYTHSGTESYSELVDAVFGTQAPMPPQLQRETFQALLVDSLEEDCSMDTVQYVQNQLCDMIQEHKQSKEPEPLTVGAATVMGMLSDCGVSQVHVEEFGQQFAESFGEQATLSPANLVNPKLLEVKTAEATVRIQPDRGDLLEACTIDGVKYIMIRAEDVVELNGVNVRIAEEQKTAE